MPMNSAAPPNRALKIVVAMLDGGRLKGSSLNFSALKDWFDLVPEKNPHQQRGTRVELKDVKAVFFVKDFSGNPGHRSPEADVSGPGRSLEVTFLDGEKIVGSTQVYDPKRLGFFLTPLDADSNNSRIFIVRKNAREIKPYDPAKPSSI